MALHLFELLGPELAVSTHSLQFFPCDIQFLLDPPQFLLLISSCLLQVSAQSRLLVNEEFKLLVALIHKQLVLANLVLQIKVQGLQLQVFCHLPIVF